MNNQTYNSPRQQNGHLRQSAPASKASVPSLEITGSRQFTAWLAEQNISLAFTTYQAGKVFFIGLQPNGKLSIFERSFNRCMGLWAQGSTLIMSELYQLWQLALLHKNYELAEIIKESNSTNPSEPCQKKRPRRAIEFGIGASTMQH